MLKLWEHLLHHTATKSPGGEPGQGGEGNQHTQSEVVKLRGLQGRGGGGGCDFSAARVVYGTRC